MRRSNRSILYNLWTHLRYSGEGSSGLSRNLHGRTIGEPNTALEGEID